MPHRAEPRYVEVNAADASLAIFDNGKRILISRVVVGKPKSPTPILATTITAVTANPPWNVPSSIAAREILPKLARNAGYLSSQNMVLLNGPTDGRGINWRSITPARFPYRIQQLPGEKNALGRLKMEMPNRFDVYLHDTPSKSLFARVDRFFSHGCVRVQQVGALAKYALTGNPSADVARLLQPADDKTQRTPLVEPLPVYILYWTAFQNADGSVAFRKDVYGRDTTLIAALTKGRMKVSFVSSASRCNA
jgi:murein L,D-transpeptidase YcbB/YkuD